MKLCLDIGTYDGIGMLEEVATSHDKFYVGLDMKPSVLSPELTFVCFKDTMIDSARLINYLDDQLPETVEKAITSVKLAYLRMDVPDSILTTHHQIVDYSINPDCIGDYFNNLRDYDVGRLILDAEIPRILKYLSRESELVFRIGETLTSSDNTKPLTVGDVLKLRMPENVHKYLESLFDRISYVAGGAGALPFINDSFDYVCGSGVKFLYDEKGAAEDACSNLSEAQRVLKEGKVICSERGITTVMS